MNTAEGAPAWEETLRPGAEVGARWGWDGRAYEARVRIVHARAVYFQVALVSGSAIASGTWSAGNEIIIPRASTLGWSLRECLVPLSWLDLGTP